MATTSHSKMPSSMLNKALVTAFLLLLPICISAQTLLVSSSGHDTVNLPAGTSRTVLDPGGNSLYPAGCDGMLTLVSEAGTLLTISGTYYIENTYDLLLIYDGTGTNATLLGTYTGLGLINVTAISGAATLRFYSDQHIEMSGFSLTVSACGIPEGQVTDITVSETATDSITLVWTDTTGATAWTIRYGTRFDSLYGQVVTTTPTATLTGLAPHTRYFYRIFNDDSDTNDICSTQLKQVRTICPEPQASCIDYSDLNSCYVSGTYGTYNNPLLHSGILDYGSNSGLSRHTVHTDTTERDPRTNNQLRTVPSGYTSSVRLGNWSNGGEAESITYEYTVDTLSNDLLIMKYAAVLQDPNHSVTQQPRFTFQILDAYDREIDNNCYSANFIASNSLGWNSVNGSGGGPAPSTVLWKDWTTVGIDLSPLHGQTIYIKLTSYDCARQQHYGYAYFVFDCASKIMLSETCGTDIENTFTAPDGFSYRWYDAAAPDTTLDTTRSLHVTQPGEYRCAMQFIGAPTANSCTFELIALAGERYPAAAFSVDSLPRQGCDLPLILHNTSRISNDSLHSTMTNYPCEGIQWIIDSVAISNDNEITATLTPGLHTLGLIASLGGGQCTDTTTLPFYVWNPCYIDDTVTATICEGETYTLFDTAVSTTGIYIRDSVYHHRTLILTVNPTNDTAISLAITENQLPYTFLDSTYTASMLDTGQTFSVFSSQFSVPNSLGCDSTIHLTLLIRHNRHTVVDSSLCENSLPLIWNGITFTASGTTTITQPCTTPPFADSIITMVVNVLNNSTATIHDTIVQNQLPYSFLDSTFTASMLDTGQSFSVFSSQFSVPNSLGCDSIINYNLIVWHNITATADSTVCENSLPLLWNGINFTDSDTATATLYGQHGSDSIITMRLHVLRNSSAAISDTIVQNQLPYSFLDSTFTTSMLNTGQSFSVFSSQFSVPNSLGCDSIISYSLLVWHNTHTTLGQVVCDNQLPYSWCDTAFTAAGTIELQYHTVNGADSTVELTLTVNPTYEIYDTVAICYSQAPYIWSDTTIALPQVSDNSTQLSVHRSHLSVQGCDSINHLNLTVHPVYDLHYSDTVCYNQLPYLWDDTTITLTQSTDNTTLLSVLRSHLSVHGCDSLLTLHLTVHSNHHQYQYASVCNGAPYTWIDGNTYSQTTYEPTITYTDHNGCDSTLQLILNLDQSFTATMEISPTTVTPDRPEVQLRDISRSRHRQWFFGDGTDTNRICHITFPAGADSLEVLMVARSFAGCIDSVWGMVRCDRATVWAPNAFTPDESSNRLFYIPTNDIATGEVYIYTRNGQYVTRFDAITGSWDGSAGGRPCPQGAYTWVMRYTTKAQPRNERHAKGTVTLIR